MAVTKKRKAMLLVLILAVFAIRLFFEFQADFSKDSYSSFIESRSLFEGGAPKAERVLPIFTQYIVAPAFSNDILARILSAALFTAIIPIVFRLSFILTKDESASFLSSALAAFVPVFFGNTILSFSPISLFLPLFLLYLSSFFRIDNKKDMYVGLALSFILPLISPLAAILIPSLMIYFALTELLHRPTSSKEKELMFLTIFSTLWILFLMFKKAFMTLGSSAIYQNIPEKIIASYFQGLSIPEAIGLLGVLPLVFGTAAIYQKIFQPQERHAYLLMGIVFTIFFLIFRRMIALESSLLLLGILLSVLSAYSISALLNYVRNLKIPGARKDTYFILTFILLLSMVLPSFTHAGAVVESSKSGDLKLAFDYIKQNGDNETKIAISPKNADMARYYSGKDAMLDSRFIERTDANKAYNDLASAYSTPFETDALFILNKYDVGFVVLSDAERAEFGVSDLKYALDKSCFDEASFGKVKVYGVRCTLK